MRYDKKRQKLTKLCPNISTFPIQSGNVIEIPPNLNFFYQFFYLHPMTYMITKRIVKNIISLMSRPFELFPRIENWQVQSPPTSTQPTRFFFHVRPLRVVLEETPIIENKIHAAKLCTPRYKKLCRRQVVIIKILSSAGGHHKNIVGR